jgi:protein-tyrosine phosphatase
MHVDSSRKNNASSTFFVHCKAGKSRSATVVIAYLVLHESMSLSEAYNYVRRIRPEVNPNLGFWSALQKLEREKLGKGDEDCQFPKGNSSEGNTPASTLSTLINE